ncbi:GntR family transcriptional regulator [Nocardioides ginsengisoli]|uniref:GntR family transcriptional regulator n=1 Tax=Nocardioides ginsengisoli TaxID=363868 RepID=A0ABW3VYI8_9ACTN
MSALADIGGGHRSLSDEVTDAVRELIVIGQIAPGERLHERNLSTDLGVSRVPVREAILRLTIEGLIRVEPRRGAFATDIDATSVEEVFDGREVLEARLAGFAAQRRTDDDLALLHTFLTTGVPLDASEHRAIDAGFHQALIDAAHHDILARLMTPLQHHVRRLFWLTGGKTGVDTEGHHESIVEAVEAQDARLASKRAAEHVRTVRKATQGML